MHYTLSSKGLWQQDIWKTSPERALKLTLDNYATVNLDADKMSKLSGTNISKSIEDCDIEVRSYKKDSISFSDDKVIDGLSNALPNNRLDYKWALSNTLEGRVTKIGQDVIKTNEWTIDKNGIRTETATSLEDKRYQPDEVILNLQKSDVKDSHDGLARISTIGFGKYAASRFVVKMNDVTYDKDDVKINLGKPDTMYGVMLMNKDSTSTMRFMTAKDISLNYQEELRKVNIFKKEIIPDVMKSHEHSGPDII
mgnify:CR=1 FL=1